MPFLLPFIAKSLEFHFYCLFFGVMVIVGCWMNFNLVLDIERCNDAFFFSLLTYNDMNPWIFRQEGRFDICLALFFFFGREGGGGGGASNWMLGSMNFNQDLVLSIIIFYVFYYLLLLFFYNYIWVKTMYLIYDV